LVNSAPVVSESLALVNGGLDNPIGDTEMPLSASLNVEAVSLRS
jgi:hypothetical protein